MSTQTLKSIATRGSMLVAVAALLVSAVIPTLAYADALNPLTERSLLLTSSAPGFADTDGSGNSNDAPNSILENYAPAGSGPNGKKSGETFTFRVSTTKAIKTFTLQYCTSAAGKCQAPGNNSGEGDVDRNGNTSDSTRAENVDAHELAIPTSDFESVGAWTQGTGPGQFQIFTNSSAGPYVPTAWDPATSNDWDLVASNKESVDHTGRLTGKMNYLTLTNTTGSESIANGEQVKIVFNPSESIYLTNPGTGSFFVKLNTYDVDNSTPSDITPGGEHNVDGGVTVANVMTDSIHITTKVLETMSFSVGTQNPDTQAVQHGSCDPMTAVNNNRLNLGDPDAEYSLETGKAWDVFSYWRLSSNSSGGASVYYSGDTLRNTVGDSIEEIGAKKNSQPGTEQFGLALIDPGLDALDAETGPDVDDLDQDGNTSEIVTLRPFPSNHITPTLEELDVEAPYAEGGSQGDNDISSIVTANNAKFAFFDSSLTVPELIAQNNEEVITCSTAKMRYIGNIAADTPAGVYTTKINYLAAPQY